MDIYRTLATLRQGRQESIYEYFERFNYYLDRCPNHGFQLHELMKFYLDGMSMGELRIMDIMVGGSIMDRTPTEVWYLIQDRAADPKPYTEYLKLSREEIEYQHAAAERMFHQKRREAAEARQREEEAYQLAAIERVERARIFAAQCQAELDKKLAELDELEKIIENKRELKSALEPVHSSSDNEKVILPIIERAAEDTKDEELQVVPMMRTEDVPKEEWISPQSSEIIIEQDMVITTTPSIPPISNLLLPSPVQNGAIQKALRNNQVWGSLEKVTMHIPMTRNPMRMQKSEQFLDSLCINWKTRKKGENKMRSSLGKVAFHTHIARAPKQTQKLEKLPNGLHRTWKRRKKRKHIFLDNEGSMFFVYMQKSRSTFGWKPGWSSWRSISHKVTRKVRKSVSKFDGVYPWAPNIR